MAYQKKSYKKFVATAASATLVASAIVPVASAASFSDVEETHEFATYIDAAVEAGYINGYADGTFGVNDNLKRSQVVIIIGRYLESLGYESEATTSPWSDVTDEEVIKYGNILKDAGVFTGYADGTLKGNDFITRENMAVVLDRLAEVVTGVSLSDVAEEIEDVEIADLATANAAYQASIQALRDLEISTADNFNPKGNVKRGQFAKFIVTAIETIDAIAEEVTELEVESAIALNETTIEVTFTDGTVVEYELEEPLVEGENELTIEHEGVEYTIIVEYTAAEELAVESVSAINAKSLKVTFNTAVDTTKAIVEVKKGSVKVNTSAITWNDAKTEATIELSGKLTAGEYTVNVTGLSEETLTGTVTAENERVEKVAILSENAVLTGSGTATVGYTVENQYGEDITATTAIVATAGGTAVKAGSPVTASKGVATIPVETTAKEGDSIVLTLINTASGKSASQTVKISAQAAVTDIAITGLYNKDGKTLTETTDLEKDKFYLLVEGKDQYGQAVKADKLTGIIANNTNPLVAGIAVTDQAPTFTTVTVDGKEVAAVQVVKPTDSALTAGKTTVMLIATASGKNATYEVNVAEAQRTDSVTFDVPELVVAGEDLFVPITVLDKEGNAVTDIKVIKDATRGIKVSGADKLEVKVVNGVIGVAISKEDAKLAKKGYLTLVGLSSTAKSTIANIEVKEAAKPVRVDGLKSSVSTTMLVNGKLTVDHTKLTIIDQYERELTTEQKGTLFGEGSNYSLKVEDEENKLVVTVEGNVITGSDKGTEKVTISIHDKTLTTKDKTVVGSEKTVTFRVTDGTEYASYEVADVATVLDIASAGVTDTDGDYTRKLEVYGVLADGSKVQLGTDKYTVESSVEAVSVSQGELVVSAKTTDAKEYDANGNGTEDKGEDTFNAKLTVTINASGEQFVKDVTVSKEAPKAKTVKVIQNGVAKTNEDDIEKGKVITAAQNANLKELATFTVTKETVAVKDVVDFVITDQYGVIKVYDTYTAKFVGSPAVANTITFVDQSSNELFLTDLQTGEEATIKATVDGIVKEFKIVAGDIVTPSEIESNSSDITITKAQRHSDGKITVATNFAAFKDKIKGLEIALLDSNDKVVAKNIMTNRGLTKVKTRTSTTFYATGTGGVLDSWNEVRVGLDKLNTATKVKVTIITEDGAYSKTGLDIATP